MIANSNGLANLFQKKATQSSTCASGKELGLVLTRYGELAPEDRPLALYTNTFAISVGAKSQFQQVSLVILPEVSPNSPLFSQFFKQQPFLNFLSDIFGTTWIRIKDKIYSLGTRLQSTNVHNINVTHDEQEYLIEVHLESTFDQASDPGLYSKVTARLAKRMLNNLKFQNLLTRNQIYDPSAFLDYSTFGFQMWPGYLTKLTRSAAGKLYLNVRCMHQVIRTDSVLDKLLMIREVSQEQNLDYQEEIRKVFIGVKVVSKYNNVCYKITDVRFDLNTESTFQLHHLEGSFKASFYDYFTKRYSETITQKKQPLLQVTRSTG